MSCKGLRSIWQHITNLPRTLQAEIAFTIYVIMIDDDDEIRQIGAEITIDMLDGLQPKRKARGIPIPTTACQMLCAYLVRQHTRSERVITEALARTTGAIYVRKPNFTPVLERLQTLLAEQDALFAVEKQNLYIDPVREASIWSRVLKRLDIFLLPPTTAADFTVWTLEGLDTLLNQTSKDRDGPLGWTSKPQIFALGMQVFSSADVLLEWRVRYPRKVKIRGSELRRKLWELRIKGLEMELHPLWIEEIERILERSVVNKVRMVATLLLGLPGGGV